MKLTRSITIYRRPEEVSRVWLDREARAGFTRYLELTEETRGRWVESGDDGPVSWDVTVTEHDPGKRIAWEAIADRDGVHHSGSVRFEPAPGDRGTEVRVELIYEEKGTLGSMLDKLLGKDPADRLDGDLRRFKQRIEIGELLVSDGSPEGVGERALPRQEPSRPKPVRQRRSTAATAKRERS